MTDVSTLVICGPTRIEAAALRRGGVQARVETVGVGPTAVARAGAGPVLRSAPAVVIAGVAGALDPRLQPGDVVVADEVRGPSGSRPLPGAVLLAAELRRAGLSVHVGPVVSSDRIVTGAARAMLGVDGALAVDMESAYLLDAARPASGAVVRVVADVAGRPLLRPSTVGRFLTAVRALVRVAPALDAWGAAADERRVLLAGPRSFCAGVVRAIDIVERALEQRGAPIYVRKQIVHNVHVVRDLQRRGAVFVEELDEVPEGASVVFSAHGVAPEVRQAAAGRRLDVIDATCPLVSKVHTEVRRFADSGDTVIFIGHEGHEETVGTMGERPASTVLVEDTADARAVQVADPHRVSYLVQTTLAADEVAGVVDVLQERFPTLRAPASDDICYATTNRQEALQAVAVDSELALVIGSQNSSNSKRLVEKSLRLGTPAHLIDSAEDIRLEWLVGATTVGVTAGASAPAELVDGVVDVLRGLGPIEVVERDITTENVRFTLPKEVRQP